MTNTTDERRTRRTPEAIIRDVVEAVAWGEREFDGGLVASRSVPTRDIRRAAEAGLVESAGTVEVCDGNGFPLQSGRTAEGWKLTDAGKAKLAGYNAADAAEHEKWKAANGY